MGPEFFVFLTVIRQRFGGFLPQFRKRTIWIDCCGQILKPLAN